MPQLARKPTVLKQDYMATNDTDKLTTTLRKLAFTRAVDTPKYLG